MFASDYTDHELVEVVREVTLHINPKRPKTASLRAFDGARAAAGNGTRPARPRS